MKDYRTRIEQAGAVLREAEYILAGGGAGLSDAAGIKYSGSRFTDNFAPFIEKYGFTDLYTSSFYPFQTEEEFWAYWAKHISLNRYEPPAAALYRNLLSLLRGKNYFVVTTNVEYQFHKAGFPEEKIFMVQGDYGYFQCAAACHNTLYYNEEPVNAMVAATQDCGIPSNLVPQCPVCGGKMDINVRKNDFFVQDENWYKAESRYKDFLNCCAKKKTAYLELGAGFNTPGVIRYPFEQFTYANTNARLIRINRDDPAGENANKARTITFTEDMGQTILALLQEKELS
ncbi:MAG: Sir2 silent information regulator family NAD-dependent deacetylase [Spirochaetaceae bacterium]|jgi:NAD-dependent SIR2 family protein deacetylase|nr:Sir2 silent information regulator family NAD-dependent deacetylase [Spirochaetaceae bacterium]